MPLPELPRKYGRPEVDRPPGDALRKKHNCEGKSQALLRIRVVWVKRSLRGMSSKALGLLMITL